MGWIAVGTGTLVAAYAVYALVTRYSEHDTHRQNLRAEHEIHRLGEEKEQNGRPKAPNGSIPAPPTVTAPEQPTAPSIIEPAPPDLMPPPPRPPSLTPEPPRLNPPQISSMPPPPRRTQPPLRSASPPRLNPPTLNTAPPRPNNTTTSLRPPPSAASSLRVPQTKTLSNTHMQPATSTLPLPPGSKKSSRAITLAPGYSPLDWAALVSSPTSTPQLRGHDAPSNGRLLRVSPAQLRRQTGRKGKDAWTSYQGRVYNVTPYLPFHPGGKGELMRGVGRDSGELFMEVHPWVNWEGMLGECLVGILVGEGEGDGERTVVGGGEEGEGEGNELEEMD